MREGDLLAVLQQRSWKGQEILAAYGVRQLSALLAHVAQESISPPRQWGGTLKSRQMNVAVVCNFTAQFLISHQQTTEWPALLGIPHLRQRCRFQDTCQVTSLSVSRLSLLRCLGCNVSGIKISWQCSRGSLMLRRPLVADSLH